jgi:hypothetical protein
MARLDAALARFSAALDLLEAKLEERGEHTVPAEIGVELSELRQERDHLLARLTILEEESSTLAGVSEAVETRLDGAIAEIRAVLGRG